MQAWLVPPPKDPTKTKEDFHKEREERVRWLIEERLLRSERIQQALLTVPREEFIPAAYRDYAYLEVPLPLPGKRATISCPHSYPLFYEPLDLDEGHRFLEVGTGSGYGAAVANAGRGRVLCCLLAHSREVEWSARRSRSCTHTLAIEPMDLVGAVWV